MGDFNTDRRSFVAGGLAALALPACLNAQTIAASGTTATIETAQGKIRGLRVGAIHLFKGVAYAADTSGRNRFMAPQAPVAWAGVRDAYTFGDRAPQNRRGDQPQVGGGVPRYGENCCVLNIHTPNLDVR